MSTNNLDLNNVSGNSKENTKKTRNTQKNPKKTHNTHKWSNITKKKQQRKKLRNWSNCFLILNIIIKCHKALTIQICGQRYNCLHKFKHTNIDKKKRTLSLTSKLVIPSYNFFSPPSSSSIITIENEKTSLSAHNRKNTRIRGKKK